MKDEFGCGLVFGNYHINWDLELWQDETEMRIKFSGFFGVGLVLNQTILRYFMSLVFSVVS